MLAIRQFEERQFAEALRTLVELQEKDPSLRLAYEMVQRIYSLSQKGKGAVALRGF